MSDYCASMLMKNEKYSGRATKAVDQEMFVAGVCAGEDEAYLLPPRYCRAMIPILGFIVIVLVREVRESTLSMMTCDE